MNVLSLFRNDLPVCPEMFKTSTYITDISTTMET
jgi:hypothetical protein